MIDEKISHDSPDNMFSGKDITWQDRDATPFFVLNNGKVERGIPQKTHMETLSYWFRPRIDDSMTDDEIQAEMRSERRNMRAYDHILLQGRYWEYWNYFSFWSLSKKLIPLAVRAMQEIADHSIPCKLFYRDVEYDVDLENGIVHRASVKEKDRSYSEGKLNTFVLQKIRNTWNNEVDKAGKNMLVSMFDGNDIQFRRPRMYEAYAIAAARIVDLCHERNSTLVLERFYDFVNELTHGEVTFDDLLDYYHFRLRKKMVGRGDMKSTQGIIATKFTPNGKWIGKLENFLNQNGIEDTQYQLMPDGANVTTTFDREAERVIACAAQNGFLASNVRRFKLGDENVVEFHIQRAGGVNESKTMERDTVQKTLFGDDIEVKAKKSDRGGSDRRKAIAKERSERKKAEKKRREKEEFERKWAERGVIQNNLF